MDAGQISSNQIQSNLEKKFSFGYRFHPTPSEILQGFLVPKMKGEPLPSKMLIKDLDVYQFDPDQIPKNESKYARENEAYFFVPVTRKDVQGDEDMTRATPNGHWRSYETEYPLAARDGSLIGYKNKFEFYQGKDPKNGVRTDWRLVEYRTNFRLNDNLESYMVCKINIKVRDGEDVPDEEDDITKSGAEEMGYDDMMSRLANSKPPTWI